MGRTGARRAERGEMRILVRLALILVVPAAVGLAVLLWYAKQQRFVSTDNAYVKSNLIAISPSIDGRVVDVHVADDQAVGEGDLLISLDRRPHEIALARAEARLAAVRNDIASMQAQYAQIQAELVDAQERVRYMARRRAREQRLATRGMTTESKLDEVEYDESEAAQRVRALEQRARQALAELGGRADVEPEAHPKYLEALAARDEARLALEYTQMRAPADGIVSRMKLQPGEWIESGRTVFTLIEVDRPWVEANLKETQLAHLRVGQPVRVAVDAYPGAGWSGRVASIAAATGSEFLVLPAQNATGNWVKVVQRVPVRVELEPSDDPRPLRAGMTVTVSIDTGREAELLSLVRAAKASLGLD